MLRTALLTLVALLSMQLPGCSSSSPPPRHPHRPDPTIRTLDRLIGREEGPDHSSAASSRAGLQRCLQHARLDHPCSPPSRRTLAIRLALDQRYPARWPAWEQRLGRTVACVNTLFSEIGMQFEVSQVLSWSPDRERNDLYQLLDRLQRDVPYDGKSLAVGIAVWDERRVYSAAGGEIGLSQRASCVVPSWPRVENDCVILAHELGHLVGARHVPGKQWIMGWAARPFHLPATDPIARVTALYRFHPRNREAIALHREAHFTRSGFRLSPGCRQRLSAVDRCWGL